MVGGLLFSMALTSFLTGVTEPIEFSFMFLAPVLYVIHALLTGISLAICQALGIHLGFTFSAGAIDYVLNYGLSTRGWLAIPVGVAYAAAYYGLFRFFIRKFNMATPGREPANVDAQVESYASGGFVAPTAGGEVPRAARYIAALGGASNLTLVEQLLEERPEIELLTAMQGRVGLDLARQHSPGLVLLDLHLPDLPGWEVLSQLKADTSTAEIPVVVISADATGPQVKRLLKAGAVSYLTKPLDVAEFFRVLDQTARSTNGTTKSASVPDLIEVHSLA